MMKSRVSLWILIVLMLALLTGCAVSNQQEEGKAAASLRIVVAAPYMAEENADKLADLLQAALPQLHTEDAPLLVQWVATGDTERDPMGTMAGMAQLTSMLAEGDAELLICDADNARRYADNGAAYIPLNELFTEKQQTVLGIVPAAVPLLDDEANLTGAFSAPCGVDLSQSEGLHKLLGADDLGAYVLTGSSNVLNAKEVIAYLATIQ